MERFWSKVDKAGPVPAHRPALGPCWLWTGSKTGRPGKEYGRFLIGSRTDGTRRAERATRVALELKLGRPLRAGRFACHECDNPQCCNPEHLYEGTPKQNVRDALARGRHANQHATTSPRGKSHSCKVA